MYHKQKLTFIFTIYDIFNSQIYLAESKTLCTIFLSICGLQYSSNHIMTPADNSEKLAKEIIQNDLNSCSIIALN